MIVKFKESQPVETAMPGAVARTSTYALNNATLPFALQIADRGWVSALQRDEHLRNGLNVWNRQVTNQPVTEALCYDFVSPVTALEQASA